MSTEPTDVQFTIEEVKEIFEQHAMRAAGRAMKAGGELLMACRPPTRDEEDNISTLAGACDALTALGRELSWIPGLPAEEPAPTPLKLVD